MRAEAPAELAFWILHGFWVEVGGGGNAQFARVDKVELRRIKERTLDSALNPLLH